MGLFDFIKQKNNMNIEDFFKQNEQYIFNDIILNSIFSANNKYSDTSVLVMIEPDLQNYFENSGYQWNNNKETIKKLVKSNSLNKLSYFLNNNYQYYLNNKIIIDFSQGHFGDWLKKVIDKSILDKKPVTKQFARMIIANYYYYTYLKLGDFNKLYNRILSMISFDEFENWIQNSKDNFDNVIDKIEKRFIKIGINDIEKNILVKQIFESKLFKKALTLYDSLDSDVRNCSYSKEYINIIDEANPNNQSNNNPNINNDMGYTQNQNNQPDNIVDSVEPKKDKNPNSSTNIFPSSTNNDNKVDFDAFLRKLGGARNCQDNVIADFFENIQCELEFFEKVKTRISFNDLAILEKELDDDISSLKYI